MPLRLICVVLAMFLLASCAMTRTVATPYDNVTLTASVNINPDPRGRPAPLTVRLYELSSRTTFDYIDFDAAFFNSAVVLSDELLSTSEQVVLPQQSVSHRIELNEKTKFIGIVAAYRDIDRAKWKLVYPVNSNWFQSHTVQLSESELRLERGTVETKVEGF